MERETPPEGTVVRRPGQGDLVSGALSREHWIVPVHGLAHADRLLPPPPGTGSGVQPGAWRSHPHPSASLRDRSPMPRRRLAPVHQGAALGADEMRMIGRRIRRIRHARDKSLRVIAGLAGMGKSTLHRIERGERELTLSELVALSSALETTPSTLIRLPDVISR